VTTQVSTLRARRALAFRRAAALGVFALVLFPVMWLLQMSVRPVDDVLGAGVFTPTLAHYRSLWTGNFPGSFVNSIIVSTVSTVLALALGVPAAYTLARARLRRSHAVRFWILATRMAPPIAFTIPFFLAFKVSGLIDTRLGLIIVYLTFNLALVIWMMQTFFETVPTALEEAAWIDGCGPWEAFWRIALPLAAPGLGATGVLCFIYSWNDFFFALVLTRTQAVTAPVAIVNFMQYEGWEWGKIAAGAVLVMLPVLAFTFVVRRYLVAGLTAGGVKE
jgi:multiple sugar transport system permease protein